ncbi:hypothetical protein ONZ45_g18091 [Pleurotus djamor]|nr:hypothetical protein ONZ45_g18091 [Pleurotus djamor]
MSEPPSSPLVAVSSGDEYDPAQSSENFLQSNENGTVAPVCLLTRRRSDMACIEYSHVLPRALKDDVLTKLEYVWGMSHDTLNIDSISNIQTLSVEMHQYFDRTTGGWAWIPPANIICDLFDAYIIKNQSRVNLDAVKSLVGQSLFSCRFFPFPAMKRTTVVTFDGHYPGGMSEKEYTVHVYPHKSIAECRLHVKPHFLIFDTGRKLAALCNCPDEKHIMSFVEFLAFLGEACGYSLGLDGHLLYNCMYLYLRWVSTIPTTFMSTEPSNPSGPLRPRSTPSTSHSQPPNRKHNTKLASRSAPGPKNISKRRPSNTHPQSSADALVLPINSISLAIRFFLPKFEEEDDDSVALEEVDDESVIVDEDDTAFMLRIKAWIEEVSQALAESNGPLQIPSLLSSSSFPSTDSDIR